MIDAIKKNAAVITAAVLASMLTAGLPPLAAAVFDAQNAHKVDGKHAVGSKASKKNRRGKLVATNPKGFLPNNILKKALDANKLDGLDSKAFARKYAQVKVVAKTGGDSTSIPTALASITDASAGKRYLVHVAPGRYVGKVGMKPFVDIVGSGRDVTTISCQCAHPTNSNAGPDGPSTVNGASDSRISGLTIENTGGSTAGEAISASSVDHFVVEDVRLTATADESIWGAFFGSANVTMRDVHVDIEGSSGDQTRGIEVFGGSSVTVTDSKISAASGSDNVGVSVSFGPILDISDTSVHSAASAGGSAIGMLNQSAEINAHAVRVDSQGSGTSYIGVQTAGGTTNIRNSFVLAAGPVSVSSIGVYNLGALATTVNIEGSSINATGPGPGGVGLQQSGTAGNITTKVVSSVIAATTAGGNQGIRLIGASGGTITVDASRVVGSSNTIERTSGTIRIGGSAMIGGPTSGTVTCANNWDDSYTAHSTTCPS